MYCTHCGKELGAQSNYCAFCGQQAQQAQQTEPDRAIATSAENSKIQAPEQAINKPKMVIRTNWMTFWTYFSLPVGGISNFFLYDQDTSFLMMVAPLSLFQFIVAVGLHKKRLWAWRCNWIIIILTWIAASIPITYGTPKDNIARFALFMFILFFVWMWPNQVYWTKRKILFN